MVVCICTYIILQKLWGGPIIGSTRIMKTSDAVWGNPQGFDHERVNPALGGDLSPQGHRDTAAEWWIDRWDTHMHSHEQTDLGRQLLDR